MSTCTLLFSGFGVIQIFVLFEYYFAYCILGFVNVVAVSGLSLFIDWCFVILVLNLRLAGLGVLGGI